MKNAQYPNTSSDKIEFDHIVCAKMIIQVEKQKETPYVLKLSFWTIANYNENEKIEFGEVPKHRLSKHRIRHKKQNDDSTLKQYAIHYMFNIFFRNTQCVKQKAESKNKFGIH